MKRPLASLRTVRTRPVSWFRTSTLAPAMAPPPFWVTRPANWTDTPWASNGAAQTMRGRSLDILKPGIRMGVPPVNVTLDYLPFGEKVRELF